jgi:hypothetical protein
MRINRSDIIQKAVNDLASSASGEKIPNETLDKVQLTYGLNRQFSSFVSSTSITTTGTLSLTLPSVSAGAEIYITGITASFAKDATCDIATGRIAVSVTPDASNVSTNIFNFAVLTLTADAQTVVYTFPYPLKVRAGATPQITGTFTVGALTRALSVVGFTTTSN